MQTRFPTLAMSTVAAAFITFMSACSSIPGFGSTNSVESANFGLTKGGEATEIYTLKNKNGLIAKVSTFGATLVELHVPDRDGKLADIINGFDVVSGYEGEGKANRLADTGPDGQSHGGRQTGSDSLDSSG